jgi:hypothetical protein
LQAHCPQLICRSLGLQDKRFSGRGVREAGRWVAAEAAPTRAQEIDTRRRVTQDEVDGASKRGVLTGTLPQELCQSRIGALGAGIGTRCHMDLKADIEACQEILKEIDETPAGVQRGFHEVESASADHDVVVAVRRAEGGRVNPPSKVDAERGRCGPSVSPGRAPL